MSAGPMEIRMARLEGAYEQVDKRIAQLNSTVDSRFAQIDTRIDGLGRKLDGVQWRLVSLIVATWITTILAVLFKR